MTIQKLVVDVVDSDAVVQEDVVSEDVLGIDAAVQEDVVSEDVLGIDAAVQEDVVSEDVLGIDAAVPEDVVSENVVSEDVVSEDVLGVDRAIYVESVELRDTALDHSIYIDAETPCSTMPYTSMPRGSRFIWNRRPIRKISPRLPTPSILKPFAKKDKSEEDDESDKKEKCGKSSCFNYGGSDFTGLPGGFSPPGFGGGNGGNIDYIRGYNNNNQVVVNPFLGKGSLSRANRKAGEKKLVIRRIGMQVLRKRKAPSSDETNSKKQNVEKMYQDVIKGLIDIDEVGAPSPTVSSIVVNERQTLIQTQIQTQFETEFETQAQTNYNTIYNVSNQTQTKTIV
ncbi:hypothetical protein AYI69_g4860 [Smittium culicis]|uniref:Uncharacterized protein n=1 Tax=Smittium culicis TaxID=133412 RepID=A0A1R1YA70_9FUNG|nr:hypothetical protein AYI69_g4860 [Smittium culicis]